MAINALLSPLGNVTLVLKSEVEPCFLMGEQAVVTRLLPLFIMIKLEHMHGCTL